MNQPATPAPTYAERREQGTAHTSAAAEKVRQALLLAHRGPKDGSMTEAERLAAIDSLLHDAINDLGRVRNAATFIARMSTEHVEYGIRWQAEGPTEVGHVSTDPDYYVHRDILTDETLAAMGPVKVARTVIEGPWEPVA